jgi:YD repeat-containing protein
MDTVTVTMENKGLADLNDVSLALTTTSGTAAPAWVLLNSSASVGTIAVGGKREVSFSFSPTAGSIAEGVYTFYLRVTSSNYQTVNYPVYVSVTQSGIGGVIFKVSDIYTGTLNASNQLIQGLSGATITLQNEQVTTVKQTKNTDSLGEALFTGMATGVYKYKITAANHQEQIGRLWIKPGITNAEQVFLDYNLVTISWEVKETTIKDTYNIVITAVYETNVPAPVLVIQPTSVVLPVMRLGDVYNGEFTITNQGLVRANNLKMALPLSNSYYKYEALSGIPTSLGAKERITIPYRVTALSSADQSDNGSGSGGGCSSYVGTWEWTNTYPCANGSQQSGSGRAYFTHVFGTCTTAGSGQSTGTYGNPFPPGPNWGGRNDPPGGLAGAASCPPPEPERPTCPGCPGPSCPPPDSPPPETVGSSVDPLRGEYLDDITDLAVKAPGRLIEVKRRYYDDAWHFDTDSAKIEIVYGSDGTTIDSINNGGVTYKKTDTYGKVFSFRSTRTIYVKDGGGYRWEDKSGNWAEFDTAGRMTSYGTPSAKTTLLYESGTTGRLIGALDNANTQVLWYEYNASSKLSAVRDATNRRVRYDYDTSGRLTKVTDITGKETTYTYDASDRLSSKRDAAGRTRTITYNNWGYVASVKDGNNIGKSFDYSYDSATQQYYSQIKYPAGKIIEHWFDRTGNTLRTDINGRTVKGLILDGNKRTITDAAGNKTIKEYDGLMNLLKQTNPDNTTITYEYESRFNNVTKETNEKGIVTTYSYDSSGNLLQKVEAAGTANQRVTSYTYDAAGNPLTITAPGNATTTMTYNAAGNMISLADPEGATTTMTYDVMGNVPTRTDARGKVWTYTYDNLGRLLTQRDPLTHTTTFEYDGVGNKIKETDAEGKIKTFEYDSDNRMTKATDALGNATLFTYDPDGKLIRQTDAEGKVTAYEYDIDGRPTKTIDGNANHRVCRHHIGHRLFNLLRRDGQCGPTCKNDLPDLLERIQIRHTRQEDRGEGHTEHN